MASSPFLCIVGFAPLRRNRAARHYYGTVMSGSASRLSQTLDARP
jgi:hypothetical protein